MSESTSQIGPARVCCGRVRRERTLSEDSGGRLCSFRTG
jgi:hypothetical protein